MSGRPDHAAARWADDARGGTSVGAGFGVGGVGEVGGVGGSGDGDRDIEGAEGAEGAESAEILADVAAISAQRDEYLESLLRLKAEFDNYRKRVARLQDEQTARAEANLVGKLLPVIDNLDLAWAHLGPRDANGEGVGGGPRGDEGVGAGGIEGSRGGRSVSEEARAISQARDQLLEVLGRAGLERLDSVGVPFDPTVHDAVAHTDASAGVGGGGGDALAGDAGGGGEGAGGDGHGAIDGDTVSGPSPRTMSVDEVLRAGYRWRGQVLRPAMVRVRG